MDEAFKILSFGGKFSRQSSLSLKSKQKNVAENEEKSSELSSLKRAKDNEGNEEQKIEEKEKEENIDFFQRSMKRVKNNDVKEMKIHSFDFDDVLPFQNEEEMKEWRHENAVKIDGEINWFPLTSFRNLNVRYE